MLEQGLRPLPVTVSCSVLKESRFEYGGRGRVDTGLIAVRGAEGVSARCGRRQSLTVGRCGGVIRADVVLIGFYGIAGLTEHFEDVRGERDGAMVCDRCFTVTVRRDPALETQRLWSGEQRGGEQ